jgi:hypothetical protein
MLPSQWRFIKNKLTDLAAEEDDIKAVDEGTGPNA